MALQNTQGVWMPPYIPLGLNDAISANTTSFLIDGAAEKVAFLFRVPKGGTGVNIRKISFLTGTVTTGDTLKGGIYTVDATTGDPTTTAYKGMVAGTLAVADTDDNLWLTITLGTDATDVVQGDLVAAVIEFNSFVAGAINLASAAIQSRSYPMLDTYLDHFTAAWAKSAIVLPTFAIEYSDGSYASVETSFPAATFVNTSFNSGSNPDERALKFSVPFSCKIGGGWVVVDLDNPADVVLYDSDGSTALATVSLDPDVRASTARGPFYFRFASDITLTKDTFYYLSLKPTSGSNITNASITVGSAAVLDQMPGGQNFHMATRVDAGAWTPVTTARPMMGISITALDDGVGGGGGTGRVISQ